MRDIQKSLFAPFEYRTLKLSNRIVMAPMTRSRAIGSLPNDKMVEYYEQRSSAGLIISESIVPTPNGLGYPRIPGIFSADQIDGWRNVVEAVHRRGGKMFAQISHAGRIGSSINLPEGAEILAPSKIGANVNVWTDVQGLVVSDIPREMDETDIGAAINEFVIAAENAMAAGFDGIELHGGNGYLFEQFLNPNSNTRTDRFGGNVSNRCRFIVDVVTAVSQAVGADKVGIRFSPFNTLNAMPHYDEILETYDFLAHAMKDLDLLYIHLIDTVTRLGQDGDVVRDALADCFKQVRSVFNGIIILNGGYTKTRAIADIEANKTDLISFGIPFIANPDLPYRLENDLELTKADTATFYAPGPEGFTDYPAYQQSLVNDRLAD